MTKTTRELIRNKYNSKCAYCGVELGNRWHVDHIDPVVRGVDSGVFSKPQNHNIENMNPSCASCNIQKNSFTLEQFRENIKQFVKSLNQYSTQYKFAKKYGLITETNIDVKFYFETL